MRTSLKCLLNSYYFVIILLYPIIQFSSNLTSNLYSSLRKRTLFHFKFPFLRAFNMDAFKSIIEHYNRHSRPRYQSAQINSGVHRIKHWCFPSPKLRETTQVMGAPKRAEWKPRPEQVSTSTRSSYFQSADEVIPPAVSHPTTTHRPLLFLLSMEKSFPSIKRHPNPLCSRGMRNQKSEPQSAWPSPPPPTSVSVKPWQPWRRR